MTDSITGNLVCAWCGSPIIVENAEFQPTCHCLTAEEGADELQTKALRFVEKESGTDTPPEADDLTREGYLLVQVQTRAIAAEPCVWKHLYEYQRVEIPQT